MDRGNKHTSYFLNDRVITFRKRKRFKLREDLTHKQAFILTLAELGINETLLNRWKYNPVTGWVSIELR